MKNALANPYGSNHSIKTSNKLVSSLKNIIEKLDLIPELDDKKNDENLELIKTNEENYIENIQNLIKNTRNKRLRILNSISSLDEIDKFNASIIKNKNWGAELLSQKNSPKTKRNAIKPTLSSLSKELGNIFSCILHYNLLGLHVVNKKLPRARVLNIKGTIK